MASGNNPPERLRLCVHLGLEKYTDPPNFSTPIIRNFFKLPEIRLFRIYLAAMDVREFLNENDGYVNTLGQLGALKQRDQLLAKQEEQIEAMNAQTKALEDRNKIEADRAEIESQRLDAEEAQRELQRQQAEHLRQLRNLMADSLTSLQQLKRAMPAS